MKYLLRVAVCLLCFVSVAQAEIVAPDVLVKTTAEDVLAIIKQDKDIQAGNRKKILALVNAKVLPHFDFDRMTETAAGKPFVCPTPEQIKDGQMWVCATPEQHQAVVTEFRNLLVSTYATAFSVYRDQTIEIKPFKMVADATEVTVKTNIIKPGAPPIPVNYEMEKTADGWKVVDLIVDNLRLVASYRGTFKSAMRESGIDGLIKVLSDKNAKASNVALHKADAK